jgi:hypothetical protein
MPIPLLNLKQFELKKGFCRFKIKWFYLDTVAIDLGYKKYRGAYTREIKKGSRFHLYTDKTKKDFVILHIDHTNKDNKHYVAIKSIDLKKEKRRLRTHYKANYRK